MDFFRNHQAPFDPHDALAFLLHTPLDSLFGRRGKEIGAIKRPFDIGKFAGALVVMIQHPHLIRDNGTIRTLLNLGRLFGGMKLPFAHKLMGQRGGEKIVGKGIIRDDRGGVRGKPRRDPALEQAIDGTLQKFGGLEVVMLLHIVGAVRIHFHPEHFAVNIGSLRQRDVLVQHKTQRPTEDHRDQKPFIPIRRQKGITRQQAGVPHPTGDRVRQRHTRRGL